MTFKLFIQAITKLFFGVLWVGFFIFIPAGTLFFANGWLFMTVLFVPMLFAGLIMMIQNPELLKRRLYAKEQQKAQSKLIRLSGLMFTTGFIVSGLDFRFHWSNLPGCVVAIASFVFLLAYLLYAEIIRENMYLSRTIEVQENQRVIDTGLYGIIRHPMYLATILLFLAMPIILGSIWAFVVFLAYPFILIQRIRYEEIFLEQELAGYSAYKQKVKYRLIPFIW